MGCGCGQIETGGSIERCCDVNPRPAQPIQPGQEPAYLLADAEPENNLGLRPVVTSDEGILIYID